MCGVNEMDQSISLYGIGIPGKKMVVSFIHIHKASTENTIVYSEEIQLDSVLANCPKKKKTLLIHRHQALSPF